MPTSERTFRRGDIVVVPFPYSDQLAEKRRPALVVSKDNFNASTGLLWVVMITSKVQKAWVSDIVLDHAKVGLTVPSVIRVAKLATIEGNRVMRVVGKLGKGTKTKVAKAIQGNLA